MIRKAIVMAAGKGTRMKSELPKVLFQVCGRPMLFYVLDALEAAGIEEIITVIGYRGDLVREAIQDRKGIRFAEQKEQLGTGHAVMMCRDILKDTNDPVMVIAGDSPMIQASSVNALFDEYNKIGNASCILGTIHKDNPFGMGRILRDAKGNFTGIVEERDATEEQKKITEINMSYYLFNTPDMLNALDGLKTNNNQHEYYITDIPAILLGQNKKVYALPVLKPVECLGVNTLDDLAVVEAEMLKRHLDK